MRATPIPDWSRRLVFGRSQQRCERCGLRPTMPHWHHRRSRSVRDVHTHHPCNGVCLCPACHEWVHGHPMQAWMDGWIVSRHTDNPETVPITSRWGERLHHCDGTYSPSVTDEVDPTTEQEQSS